MVPLHNLINGSIIISVQLTYTLTEKQTEEQLLVKNLTNRKTKELKFFFVNVT